MICSLTNITNDIKVALLILKNRNSAMNGNMFIPPWFLSTAPCIWLADNYDLTLYMKLNDIFVFSRCQTQENVEFRYDGQTIENIVIHRRLAVLVFTERYAADTKAVSKLPLVKTQKQPSTAYVSGENVIHL